jgi:GrpB-like predicted nucleotidyltransferase (UPF0157 family)/ADP-ribose pyrophosphatase YjhB (NUDIX family)
MTVPRTLRLVDDDGAWPARFAAEAERIRGVLGSLARAVEHVGSTAVPGLGGKPVLDVGVAVASVDDADACVAPLEALGYAHRGPYGDDPRRRYYVRDVEGRRVAQLHLYILPAAAWDEKLAFRDALRADPALAAAYAAEKRRVAEAVGWDKSAYSVAKGPFVEAVLARLRAAGQTPAAAREVRYQAAVVDAGRLLLLRCQPAEGPAFWVLPGGGREPGETEAACVAREVREEAGLDVVVGAVLSDVPADPPDGTYRRWRTYLCRVTGGEAAPGGGEGWAALTAVRWLALDDPTAWEPALRADAFLYPQLQRIRAALGAT